MPLRLRVIPRSVHKAGEDPGSTTERIVEFGDEIAEIRIGRRAGIELCLPFKALSGLHARLVHKGGNAGRGNVWLAEDLDSKNGTYVGKSRLRPGEQRLLFAGDTLDLGQVQVIFDGHSTATSGAEGTATIARRLVNDMFLAAPDASAPTLTVIEGAPNVETLKLVDRDRPYFIGRGKTCDLRFDLDELSRQHASLTRGWNGVILRDLGSKNGIQVNGNRVTSQRIADGDLIEMGPLKLRLMDPEDKYLRDLDDNPDRPAPGESRPKPAVVMPAALAVSLPPTPAAAPPPVASPPLPPAAAPPPAAGALHPMAAMAAPGPATGSGAPRKLSRLAPRPAPGPAAQTTLQPGSLLDEHHPAISARRPPPDPGEPKPGEDQMLVRRARKTMFVAVAVLVAIAAVGLVLILGNFFNADP